LIAKKLATNLYQIWLCAPSSPAVRIPHTASTVHSASYVKAALVSVACYVLRSHWSGQHLHMLNTVKQELQRLKACKKIAKTPCVNIWRLLEASQKAQIALIGHVIGHVQDTCSFFVCHMPNYLG